MCVKLERYMNIKYDHMIFQMKKMVLYSILYIIQWKIVFFHELIF